MGDSAIVARMWLLDKGLKRLVTRGELTIIDEKGKSWRYGAPEPDLNPVTVRFADGKVANEIARDPGLGAAETYMDGRLILEQGTNPNIRVLESNHPSPLATGFYGNGHFAAANKFLSEHDRAPIDWALPPPAEGVTPSHHCRPR